jgi:hypothetical protein
MAVGGVVLAAGLIGFTNPKTVHAVAAALVQVTNTASNPVVTQSTGQQAAQIVHIVCNLAHSQDCVLVLPTAVTPPSDPYMVPANESLVVTAVDIMPTQAFVAGCNFNHVVYLAPGAGYAQEWVVNNASLHFAYPSGIVFATGSTIEALTQSYSGLTAATQACDSTPDQVDLRGYLTPS